MKLRPPLLTALFCCVAALALTADSPASKPNVIFFLIDDLGWRDLGCCGSTFYKTPHIDRLAADGMRFTDAHAAAALCSPTRASLLTGKYPARLHLTHILGGKAQPNTKLKVPNWTQHLPLEEVTFAEALKEAGYATAHFGKWHLGDEPFTPDKQGFDVLVPAKPAQNRHDKNVTQLTDAAIEFIRSHAKGPFLAYLCHHTVHVPFEADQALTEEYRQQAPRTGQNHPTMAAMIETLDQSVGRMMKTLDELGIARNTIIIFTSDNGGLRMVQEGKRVVTATDNTPARAGKATLYEGGTRVPLIIKWPGITPPGSTSLVPVISSDLYPTLLDMAGLPARPSQHRDGLSLAPLLKGGDTLHRKALFWHFPHYHSGITFKPCGAVRAGDWTLIESFEDNRVELYNLKDDIGETNNLAAKMPEKAAALRQQLLDWRASVSAQMPTPNPAYDSARASAPAASGPKRGAGGKPFTPAADMKGSWSFTSDPALPNVLLIGDSISVAYTRVVRQKLAGRANVYRPMQGDGPENCGDTTLGLARLDAWLTGRKWDVIHFNWGLWDLCYRSPQSKNQGGRNKVAGRLTTRPEDYAMNLERLVSRLEATGARLIWASITAVPEGEAGRFAGDDEKYNAIAASVMMKHNIPTDDLFALTKGFAGKYSLKAGDVHYTAEGSERIGEHVAAEIRRLLK